LPSIRANSGEDQILKLINSINAIKNPSTYMGPRLAMSTVEKEPMKDIIVAGK